MGRTVSRRRTLFAAASSVVIGSGITAGTAASVADFQPLAADPSPIMIAATRLSHLSSLNENEMTEDQLDVVSQEQLDLLYFIFDCSPQTVADTVVLLMAAASEISRKALNNDGSFSHEHCEVIVRRVLHFLGEREGIKLDDVGGAYLLPLERWEVLALHGTVAEAALRFNKVDKALAWNRHDEEQAMIERQIIRARHGLASPFEGDA